MKTLLSRFLLIGNLVGFTQSSFAQATIYNTLGAGSTFDTNHFEQFGLGYADRFTSPITANVGSASLALQAFSNATTISLSIRTADAGGGPGAIVGSLNSATISTNPGIVTFTATSNFQLDAGTRYWLTAIPTGGQAEWFLNDQSIDNAKAILAPDHSWIVDQVITTGLAFDVSVVPEPSPVALVAVGGYALFQLRRRSTKPGPIPVN